MPYFGWAQDQYRLQVSQGMWVYKNEKDENYDKFASLQLGMGVADNNVNGDGDNDYTLL